MQLKVRQRNGRFGNLALKGYLIQMMNRDHVRWCSIFGVEGAFHRGQWDKSLYFIEINDSQVPIRTEKENITWTTARTLDKTQPYTTDDEGKSDK